ncbi:AzlD domain-containing protein [Saccharibacillus sp. CPCC 101409]|uniref:branched-chain amino acid transporter permease n=1 Tax=Saccharibacillus sp. CPCC 101409 TaxID=3058041 RepID=UPI0026724409|nr:AzlD domain-containing protein [Saccharibacillus sp. CPCC 101409]MDO3408892.1 AzlD domain-containing protein [Saccharibacillus sp. CPCC 101409]
MDLTPVELLIFVLAIAAGAFLSRVLPFVLFRGDKPLPSGILYLGGALPPAMMALLVVDGFKSVSLLQYPYALPEMLSAGVVIALHLYKKNALLSIFGGTAVYMIALRFIFV